MARTTLTEPLSPLMKVVLNAENVGLTAEQFYRLCGDNPELRIELTAQKEIIIMSPTGSKTGWRCGEIFRQLANWAKQNDTGLAFDSNTGFILPNGAERSPDTSWIRRERWDRLTPEQQEVFAPICPDFVIELRSPSDTLAELQAKLEEYIANGAQLGFLIDPFDRHVYVYRPNRPAECMDQPESAGGDPELPRFNLQLNELW
jgi:Uma2 family endonuclease